MSRSHCFAALSSSRSLAVRRLVGLLVGWLVGILCEKSYHTASGEGTGGGRRRQDDFCRDFKSAASVRRNTTSKNTSSHTKDTCTVNSKSSETNNGITEQLDKEVNKTKNEVMQQETNTIFCFVIQVLYLAMHTINY